MSEMPKITAKRSKNEENCLHTRTVILHVVMPWVDQDRESIQKTIQPSFVKQFTTIN